MQKLSNPTQTWILTRAGNPPTMASHHHPFTLHAPTTTTTTATSHSHSHSTGSHAAPRRTEPPAAGLTHPTPQSRARLYRTIPIQQPPPSRDVNNNNNNNKDPNTSSSSATLVHTNPTTTTTITTTKWATRDIAALDFLLQIPLQNEARIVQDGWMQQQQQPPQDSGNNMTRHKQLGTGRWWEKFVVLSNIPANAHGGSGDDLPLSSLQGEELERPNPTTTTTTTTATTTTHWIAPGRRLDGDDAIFVNIPVTGMVESRTRQRSIARQAAIREFEIRVAHGLMMTTPTQAVVVAAAAGTNTNTTTTKTTNGANNNNNKGHYQASATPTPLLNGRVFFSAGGSYPMEVFSVVRYEPRKEEAARRRQKLEELGGGGSQFVFPERDWRGTSYRALLQQQQQKRQGGQPERPNLGLQNHPAEHRDDHDDDDHGKDDDTSTSTQDSDGYMPGFLDDPEMVQGRHRHVMIGDRVTGPLVSSTILFVQPTDLKAELNKQFRERFDGWEPPKSQWKFIGAKVLDGVYTLMDPTESQDDPATNTSGREDRRPRQGSLSSTNSSITAEPKDLIRMPPSLTLSKIRNAKQQALTAAVNANLEVGTLALACVYFERLCLDCRVDKSNRRLTFAACLLLASKINESNVKLVMRREDDETADKKTQFSTFVRPTTKSDTIFASLLEFFTHDWNLSLKNVFSAEWGVFAALGFSLHTKPSQVEFHFLRLMKTLELSPVNYLGHTMFSQWQESLVHEEIEQKDREERREKRAERKERKLLELERELRLKEEDEAKHREAETKRQDGDSAKSDVPSSPHTVPQKAPKKGFFNLLSLKRSTSMEKLAIENETVLAATTHETHRSRLRPVFRSPSLPTVSNLVGSEEAAQHTTIDIREADDESGGSVSTGEEGIIV